MKKEYLTKLFLIEKKVLLPWDNPFISYKNNDCLCKIKLTIITK